jgi:hypothetical protein
LCGGELVVLLVVVSCNVKTSTCMVVDRLGSLLIETALTLSGDPVGYSTEKARKDICAGLEYEA